MWQEEVAEGWDGDGGCWVGQLLAEAFNLGLNEQKTYYLPTNAPINHLHPARRRSPFFLMS